MPLVTSAQFPGINPNILGGVQQGLVNRQLIQQEQNKQRLLEQSQAQLGTRQRALGVPEVAPVDESQAQAELRMIANDPVKASQTLSQIGIVNQRQKEDAAAFGAEMLAAPNPETQTRLINERVQRLTAEGRDPKNTLLLHDFTPEQRTHAARGLQTLALTALQRQTLAGKTAVATAKAIPQVQSSKILPGGLVQMVMKDGTVQTVPPEEANETLIKAAEVRGAELQGLRAGERGEAEESTKRAAEAFKTLAATRKNIVNMNEGIRLLQEGAKSGAVEGRLPSFRAASVKLDNLRNRLGLDVIGGTTFGALSESELNFALGTALPTGLDEKELLQWMVEKRDAQMKLTANLEEAALFLGTPGNTVADFITMKKAERDQPLPQGVTEEDVIETMRVNSMSRQEVLERLRGQ